MCKTSSDHPDNAIVALQPSQRKQVPARCDSYSEISANGGFSFILSTLEVCTADSGS